MGNMTMDLVRGNYNMGLWDNLQHNDERFARVEEIIKIVQKYAGVKITWDYEGESKRQQANNALIKYLPTFWSKEIDDNGILHIWDSSMVVTA